MTLLNINPLVDVVCGVTGAHATFTAIASSVRSSNANVIMPSKVTVEFVAGTPAQLIKLAPSGTTWYWIISLYFHATGKKVTSNVSIADVVEINWSNLVVIDPATLMPSPEALAGWTATLQSVQAASVSTAADAFSATSSATSATASKAAALASQNAASTSQAQAATSAANALTTLAEVNDRAVTATVNPDDPDVLRLTFPAFMLKTDDPLILVLPIGV